MNELNYMWGREVAAEIAGAAWMKKHPWRGPAPSLYDFLALLEQSE